MRVNFVNTNGYSSSKKNRSNGEKCASSELEKSLVPHLAAVEPNQDLPIKVLLVLQRSAAAAASAPVVSRTQRSKLFNIRPVVLRA